MLVTRAPHQTSELAARLRAEGAEPVLIPTIAIVEPPSFADLDASLANLAAYDWLVFTSANAVEAFQRRAVSLGITSRPKRIAAIGPATARAVTAAGLVVDRLPEHAVAESLAEALISDAAGQTFLLVRAQEARDLLPDALRSAGGVVTIATAYRTVIPADSVTALCSLLVTPEKPLDAAMFTSASTARNLAGLLKSAGVILPEHVVRVSIGPITSEAMRELGIAAHVEAAEPSVAALAAALVAALTSHIRPIPRGHP